jgi:hypothetical protein
VRTFVQTPVAKRKRKKENGIRTCPALTPNSSKTVGQLREASMVARSYRAS